MTDLLEPPTEAKPTTTQRRDRRRKALALLAAGSVVGSGAIITLASWNDSEFAKNTFTAGVFDLEGAVTSGSFTQHATSGAAGTLAYTVPFSNLTPSDVVYAPYAVRLAANTTHDATVTIPATVTSGTVTNLTYSLFKTSSFSCNATAVTNAVGGDYLVQNAALTAGASSFTLSKGSPTTSAGAAQNLCFVVTAGAGLVQGQAGTVTWQFTATSAAQ